MGTKVGHGDCRGMGTGWGGGVMGTGGRSGDWLQLKGGVVLGISVNLVGRGDSRRRGLGVSLVDRDLDDMKTQSCNTYFPEF